MVQDILKSSLLTVSPRQRRQKCSLVFVKPTEILWWIIHKRMDTGEHFAWEEGFKYRIHKEKGRESGLRYITIPWEAIKDLTEREIRKT
jgi:hypothetical protein